MHGHFDEFRAADVLLAVSLLITAPAAAYADAGANAAMIDQQLNIVVADEAMELEYVTQLNRPAAFAEVLKIDTDGDGRMTADEQAAYFQQLAENLRRGLEVRVNGRAARLEPMGEVQLEMPFRKTYHYRLPHPDEWQHGVAVEMHNENYLDYTGRLEISLQPGDGIDVVYDSLHADDTDECRGLLPVAALSGQIQQRDMIFGYRAGSGRYEPNTDPELTGRLLYAAAEVNYAGNVALAPHRTDRRAVLIWVMTAFCFMGGGVIALNRRTSDRVVRIVLATTFLLAGCAGVCVAAHLPERQDDMPRISRAEAIQQFQRLHCGVYRAFGERSEEAVYDTLAECLCDVALDAAYDEVYQAVLDRDGRDTHFSVRRVKPIETVILPPLDDHGEPHYRVRYHWRVGGTVTHFNHTHARINEYAATYTVSLHTGAWRITDVQMRQHTRLSTESPAGRD